MYNEKTNTIIFDEDTLIPDIQVIMKKGQTLRLPRDSEIVDIYKESLEDEYDFEEEEDFYYDL